MVTLLQTRVDVTPDGIVTACSWCCSPVQLAQLAAAYPEKVSHGLCEGCISKIEGK